MKPTLCAALIACCLLPGCASYDGTYLPACAAYEGSRITLDAGSFSWEKFTDQVAVDRDGKRIDPFPGYPMTGSYRVHGDTLTMRFESGDDSGNNTKQMHLARIGDEHFLLSPAQFDAWRSTGSRDDCALRRSTELSGK